MTQQPGFDPNGQGQGPVNINGDQGTAGSFQNPVNYGDLQQQLPQQQEQAPPYSQYLDKLPASVRPAVEPIFKEWDANYTRATQQYADQLRRYEPYQQFTSYDPQALNMAVQLAQMANDQPEELFRLLGDQLGYDVEDDGYSQGQGQQQYGQQGYDDPDDDDDWRESVEQSISQLTELIKSNQEQSEEDRQATDILNYLQQVEAEKGPIDYDFVLGKAYATDDLDGALEEWYEKYAQPDQQQQLNGQQPQMVEVGGIMVPANHPAAQNAGPPSPLGAGGGLPSQTQDLGSLSPKDRMALVAQTLRAANQQGQG